MGANVFANGLEVSCEKATNQSLAAMPDVCLSPPTPPAGPIPIPYPNFSSASDTTDGTTTIQIAGGQVGMKNQSSYKQSKGDEAATKSQGMGLVTHGIQGKTYFAAWSSDVKFENANAVRLSDLTTHNHSSTPQNTGSTTASTGGPAPLKITSNCEEMKDQVDSEDRRISRSLSKNPKKREGHKASTVSVMNSNCGGKRQQKPAYSSLSRLPKKNQKRYSKGLKGGEKSKLCEKDGKSHQYTPDPRSSCTHTEARFIEDLLGDSPKNKSCTVTMKIKWKQRKGKPKEVPCKQCEKTVCRANYCGMTIKLCRTEDGKQKKKDPDFCKKHGYGSPSGK